MAGWTMGVDAWVLVGAWALVMTLGVWLLVREPRGAHHPDPGEILRDRFARGEINEEEYHRACAALGDPAPRRGAAAGHHGPRHAGRHGQEARHD